MDAKVLRWARVIQPLIPVKTQLRVDAKYIVGPNGHGYGYEYGNNEGNGNSKERGGFFQRGDGYSDGDWTGDRTIGNGQGVGRGNHNSQYGGDGRVSNY
jgi:hypothetical protein